MLYLSFSHVHHIHKDLNDLARCLQWLFCLPGFFCVIRPEHVLVCLQGEVLPIQYRQLFNGFYTVKLDEGAEEQVAHGDMSLLYNDAEASSWVRFAQTSLSSQNGNAAGPQERALQQQQQQDDVMTSCLGQDVASVESPDVLLCTPMTPAAEFAADTRKTGIANTTPAIATAAVNSSNMQEEAEEQVVPQLRRTKRTVAQKRLASSVSQAVDDPSSAGKSVQRKLSHTQHLAGLGKVAASAKTRKHETVTPVSTATESGYAVSTAEQKVHSPQLTFTEHDSDDDLFVDLTRANIKSRLSGLQAPQLSVTSPGSGCAPQGVAASLTCAVSRGGSAGGVASPQFRAQEHQS